MNNSVADFTFIFLSMCKVFEEDERWGYICKALPWPNFHVVS